MTVPTSSTRWDTRTKRTILLICLFLIGLLLWFARDVLPLIFVGIILAYLLTPVTNFFERRLLSFLPKGRRPIAILLTFVLVIIVFILILLVIVPILIGQFEEFQRGLPDMIAAVEEGLGEFLNQPLTLPGGEEILVDGEPLIPAEQLSDDLDLLDDQGQPSLEALTVGQLLEGFFGSIGDLTGQAFSTIGQAFNIFLNFVLLVVMIFFLLLDGQRFVQTIVDTVPQSHQQDAERLFQELGNIWHRYLRGQFLLSGSVGLLTLAAAMLLGLPNAIILALIAAIFEFIPNIGPLLALIPAAFLALLSQSSTIPALEGPAFVLVVVIVWGAIQNIESYILHPRIMGGSLKLHPYVVIVAVIIGASLAGPLGVIFAAPLVATARLFLRYVYAKVTDTDPFPEYRYIPPSLDDSFVIRAIRWPQRRITRQRTSSASGS